MRDLGSRNGTLVDGVRVLEAFLRSGSSLNLGAVTVRFDQLAQTSRVPLSSRTSFHGVVARSVAMRRVLALVERAASADATVLLEGETGTGKGAVAEVIHRGSGRAARPLLVVDCGALPGSLLESELFGHERSAFTGAAERRLGVFEEAEGGTVFLDEIGELPLDLQPKLLRVLESREVRRVGANQHRKVDVRIVVATNLDLRAEVNAGRFRPDLYYRLAVLRIVLRPLRERADDIPALVEQLLPARRGSPARGDRRPAGPPRRARRRPARALRDRAPPGARGLRGLALHGGKTTVAASAAGIDRVYLYKLAKRHGLRSS